MQPALPGEGQDVFFRPLIMKGQQVHILQNRARMVAKLTQHELADIKVDVHADVAFRALSTHDLRETGCDRRHGPINAASNSRANTRRLHAALQRFAHSNRLALDNFKIVSVGGAERHTFAGQTVSIRPADFFHSTRDARRPACQTLFFYAESDVRPDAAVG